jgi:hypothetical protein
MKFSIWAARQLKTFGGAAFRVRSLPGRLKVCIWAAGQIIDMRAASSCFQSKKPAPRHIFSVISAIGMSGSDRHECCGMLLLEECYRQGNQGLIYF